MSEEHNLSLYGQDGLNDFPVLKAFQQYIDAEQAKARKRMVGLSVIFGCVMLLLVIVFILVLGYFNVSARELAERNQQLNDKLVEFAMQDRDRQLAAKSDSDGKDAAIKAMTESMTKLQQQLADQQSEFLKARAAAESPSVQPSAAQLEAERQLKETNEKLLKANAELQAQQQRLADEKERQRLAEIERHRRRLYPEYYARKDAEERGEVYVPPAKRRVRAQSRAVLEPVSYYDEDDDELDDDELDEIIESTKSKHQRKAEKPTAKGQATEPAADDGKESAKPAEKPLDKPIEYFTEDEFTIPVDVKDAKGTQFRIPLN